MSLPAWFIHRPIATSLLMAGLSIAGIVAFNILPVAPLPQFDFPTISVQASLPGGSPQTMATSVATPLETALSNISGITEMTSTSNYGSTRVILQFDLSRDIDGAARDVQAAINAASSNLPANLPSNPTYRKVNPADSPVMIIALTSEKYSRGEMYDVASTILQQKISQMEGIGQVIVGGASLPAVRVELNPTALNKYGISMNNVATTIANANANLPKGQLITNNRIASIVSNDQIFKAYQYRPLIIAYNQGRPVRLVDVAQVNDSVEDVRNAGIANGKPSVVLVLFKQPGANIIKTIDGVNAMLPQLSASVPEGIQLRVLMDRTSTIRASLFDVEMTLILAMILVILVTFLFLGSVRAMLIPGIVVPVTLLGTFAVMQLLGFSLNNLSLMALTISTGFVVDDAVVVLENISRYIESGLEPMEAAIKGSGEVAFTVVSMSLSLIAVFTPILLMSGIVGRVFREFSVTLSVAILISMVVSLTLTPMMCARLLKKDSHDTSNRYAQFVERLRLGYSKSLSVALEHYVVVAIIFILTVMLTTYLYIYIPKGFFPQQDTGRLIGSIQAEQDISFQSVQKKLTDYITIIRADPAVLNVIGFVGSSNGNSGSVYITLKDLADRKISADAVINRLRPKLARVVGSNLFLQAAQDLSVGGRQSNAQFQYTLSTSHLRDLNQWAVRVNTELAKLPGIADVNSDQRDRALQEYIEIDRDMAARFGITNQEIDATLYSAFGQRQVSTMFTNMNQYHVVMEVAPPFWQDPKTLNEIYVQSSQGSMVPLSAIAKFSSSSTLLQVNHQGQSPAATLSFNLLPGVALGDAVEMVNDTVDKMGLPSTILKSFQGTAAAFQQSLANQVYLILGALLAVYIVLGILYESLVHPITILSTLPSAGVGALLALMIARTDLDVVAFIGLILLIGIVKKNAIMMIDFALLAERNEGKSPRDAIYEAAQLRFRPIMMTTFAALFGALPLVFGFGLGSELRRPLGIAIVGGLVASQLLTLYTTPVVYLLMERYRIHCHAVWQRFKGLGRRTVTVQRDL